MTSSSRGTALSLCTLAALAALVAGCSSQQSRIQPRPQSRVTADDMASTSDPIEKELQAKHPGLWVQRTPDGGIAVQIRGTSSFYSGNAPLYVLDEMPFTPGPGGALTGINPHDIESIKVLKDPADTGLYGMRGANGVIVIKTKKPGKGG